VNPADTPLLTVADLRVDFGGTHILQGVTFELPRAGITAMLGRNGVGKTTTLRAMIGEVPATGRVEIDGRSILGRPTHTLVADGIGYVPEDRRVFGGLSVAENLRLAELAASDVHEFLLVISHAKLRGATGAWVAPLAIV